MESLNRETSQWSSINWKSQFLPKSILCNYS